MFELRPKMYREVGKGKGCCGQMDGERVKFEKT